jgi:hypothetical protein
MATAASAFRNRDFSYKSPHESFSPQLTRYGGADIVISGAHCSEEHTRATEKIEHKWGFESWLSLESDTVC